MMIFNPATRKSKHIIRSANAARDAQEYNRAALLYERALRLAPDNAAIHIQCGHMFKEAGQLASAEPHYLRAKQLKPDDPDLALQLGHFYKVAGRPKEAEGSYKRAIELDPAWVEPAIELAELYRTGWRNHENGLVGNRVLPNSASLWGDAEVVVGEVAPRRRQSQLRGHAEEISINWLGRYERTHWGGTRSTLRGADAIRGFCISAVPIVELRAMLNGLRFYTGTLQSYPLKYEKDNLNKRKYVFNIWHDFSDFFEGVYELELQFVDENAGFCVHKQPVFVASPLSEDDYPDSDRLVSVSATDHRSVEDQVNSRPRMIRPAKRNRFPTSPRNVLIVRVDQLGDIIVSVPAIRRLRELLPEARLVGLLSFANAELAKTLNLFDEVVVIDFPEHEWEPRRIIALYKNREISKRR